MGLSRTDRVCYTIGVFTYSQSWCFYQRRSRVSVVVIVVVVVVVCPLTFSFRQISTDHLNPLIIRFNGEFV